MNGFNLQKEEVKVTKAPPFTLGALDVLCREQEEAMP